MEMSSFPPTRRNDPLLEGAQQLALHRLGKLAHLVEEEGPAVRRLEEPLLRLHGPGEGAANVPEQLALDQRLGDGGAVDRDEGELLPGAAGVEGGGHQLLPRSALAQDHHVGVGGGDPVDQLEDPQDRLAASDDPLVGGGPPDRFAQRLPAAGVVFLSREGGPHQLAEVRVVERLGEVVVRPVPDRLLGRLDGRVGGEHDHLGPRIFLHGRAQHLQPVVVLRHPQVGEDEVVRVRRDRGFRLGEGGGRVDLEPFLLEEELQHLPKALLVVDDEDVLLQPASSLLGGAGSPARPLHPFRRHAMCVEPSRRTRSAIAG